MTPQELKSESLSSKNSLDEDTEHSQHRPAYLSGALYPAGGNSKSNIALAGANNSMSSLTKSPVKQATTAIMDLKISTLDDQEKASWENHDSIHSKASTVASSMPHSGDDHTNTVFDDSAAFGESCASFASFGDLDSDEEEASSLSLSNSQDVGGLVAEDTGAGKRSLLDPKDAKREAL